MFYLLKIIIALVVIIGATELSKKNTTLAAILLAMPIIFFVSFTLIWEESKDRSLISDTTNGPLNGAVVLIEDILEAEDRLDSLIQGQQLLIVD